MVIERLRELDAETFRREFLESRTPVIMEGAFDHWAARHWTPSWFKGAYGQRVVHVEEDDPIELGEYIDLIRSRRSTVRAPLPYMRGLLLITDFPELLESFDVLPHFLPNWFTRWPLRPFLEDGLRVWSDLFIGPPNAGFPNLHYDTYMTHNWFAQIYGEKQFWVFDQAQRPYLYPHPEYVSDSQITELPPDPGEFPLFQHAEGETFVLGPGDLLFIPAGLWHTTRMRSVSISLSGNFVNETNFADFDREVPLHAECPFEYLRRPAFRRWMAQLNRVFDRVEGSPTEAHRYTNGR